MFPVRYPGKPTLPKLGFATAEVAEEPTRAEIQGKSIGSSEEARVATALDKLGFSYIYQYQILDIRGVKGAYVVDFLALTVPLSTPVEVFGNYWHRGQMSGDDDYRLRQIEQHFQSNANEVVIIWGNEVMTQDDAHAIVRRKVGRA